jgi:hypothetical protein
MVVFLLVKNCGLSQWCELEYCPSENDHSRDHIRTSLAESFQEFLQGSKDIIWINSGVPGSVVCVDNILAIEKR